MDLFVRYRAVVYLSDAAYKEFEGSTILKDPRSLDIDTIVSSLKETISNQAPYKKAIEIEIDILKLNKI